MIARAELGQAVRIEPHADGDLWSTTWAADSAVYAAADDSRGVSGSCDSNLAVFRIDGDEPAAMQAVLVNCMEDYGKLASLGDDGACWKANGLICLDGVLYLAVSRHYYYYVSPEWIQTAWDASVIMSRDFGRTWSRKPELGRSMFPGHTFGAPFFVQYGRDGAAGVDEADVYVYAVSSNGVWNNGSSMTLGRVRRDRIARLDASDWEFVQGFTDGAPFWGARHDTANYVFRSPGRTSMTGVHYIEPLGLYVLPQWHYTNLGASHPERWQTTRWELYQGGAPWGPWSLFHTQEFTPQGFYNPSISARHVSADGRRLLIATSGDFATQAFYGLHVVPVTLTV